MTKIIKAKKKPIAIEAWQITPSEAAPLWAQDKLEYRGDIRNYESYLVIHTLEGEMRGNNGDYLIRGIHGEIYPCKKEIFEESYEVLTEEVLVEILKARNKQIVEYWVISDKAFPEWAYIPMTHYAVGRLDWTDGRTYRDGDIITHSLTGDNDFAICTKEWFFTKFEPCE